MRIQSLLLVFCVVLLTWPANAKSENEYTEYDKVPLKVNKVGPYSNPTETYPFYLFPFCAPDDIEKEGIDLGNALEGDRIMNSVYDFRFLVNSRYTPLCRVDFSSKQTKKMYDAVMHDYYFQFLLDSMPVWGFFGEVEKDATTGAKNAYLFSHLHFDIGYNGKHVVDVNVSADPSFRILLDQVSPISFEFSFSVRWKSSSKLYENRMEKYSIYSFFPREIEVQWFAILNSLILVALLVGFVSFILMRVLKRDYEDGSNLDEEDGSTTGWKLLHGDVFRFPPYSSVLASCIGTGVQLLALAACLFVLGFFGAFQEYSRGPLYSAILICYAFTTGFAGFVSAYVHKQLGGEKWVNNCILTCVLFPLPTFVIWFFLNTVAVVYSSTVAIPFGTIVGIFLLWVLVAFPLTVLGAITGKKIAPPFDAPCRTRNVPRQIPPIPWYRGMFVQVAIAGIIPFSAIYVEIYYVFMSLWSHKLYTPYGIIFLTFCILMAVTSCICVALLFFKLSQEDHEWWWYSFLTGGSCAMFLFAYCFFFLPSQSDMTGFLQVSFYFGYMFLLSYALMLILGTVGFLSCLAFVKKIYVAVKSD